MSRAGLENLCAAMAKVERYSKFSETEVKIREPLPIKLRLLEASPKFSASAVSKLNPEQLQLFSGDELLTSIGPLFFSTSLREAEDAIPA